MSKPEWKDITSFSRDDKKRIPTTYELDNGTLRIVITCKHFYYPGEWVMHCARIAIDTYHLKNANNLEDAKRLAIEFIGKSLQRFVDDYEAML